MMTDGGYNQLGGVMRRCVITFGDGQKTAAVVRIPCQRKAVRIEDLERDIVKQFNRSQPFLKNKVTKIHLMRN